MLCLGCACGTVTWFRLCGLPRKATIEWIEAADYYTGLHVGDRTLMLRESITDLAAKLDPATFLRVHRSAIVNMNYVAEIYREGLGRRNGSAAQRTETQNEQNRTVQTDPTRQAIATIRSRTGSRQGGQGHQRTLGRLGYLAARTRNAWRFIGHSRAWARCTAGESLMQRNPAWLVALLTSPLPRVPTM